jgi:FAD/FMN-containing dehydrogenase
MWPEFYEYVTRPESTHGKPLPDGIGHYVLVETQGSEPELDAERFQNVLSEAMEAGLIDDAVLTHSQSERNALWEIRDDVLSFFALGPSIPFDISVTIDRMEDFVEEIRAAVAPVEDRICVFFGHLGDGNLHVMLGNTNFENFDHVAIEELLYSTVQKYEGSVSAEHGIGLSKRDQLYRSRSQAEMKLMMDLKKMLDPKNILNPNKIFSAKHLASA